MKTQHSNFKRLLEKEERFKRGVEALKEAVTVVFALKGTDKPNSKSIDDVLIGVDITPMLNVRMAKVNNSDEPVFPEDIEGLINLYFSPIETTSCIFDSLLYRINRYIRNLKKHMSKPRITDRRSLIRAMVRILFKNLDDAHSLLKLTVIYFQNFLTRNIQNDTSRNKNTYRFS